MKEHKKISNTPGTASHPTPIIPAKQRKERHSQQIICPTPDSHVSGSVKRYCTQRKERKKNRGTDAALQTIDSFTYRALTPNANVTVVPGYLAPTLVAICTVAHDERGPTPWGCSARGSVMIIRDNRRRLLVYTCKVG